ncbi:hypothetical protein RJ639_041036 [Escallonia herrerae]|uniref:Uncharacterized protein n=1 Tax=Escallonia herrerae TaxID=1293975 RepID=A0AA89B4H8_9ASTE|nr:hypothetical protein RJ639_041036 [Escallonia herrerae]
MIPEILSPSILDFLSLVLSLVTPLIEDPFNKSSASMVNSSEEDKAIAEKKFYLQPLPMSTPRGGSKQQLLLLFSVTSLQVLRQHDQLPFERRSRRNPDEGDLAGIHGEIAETDGRRRSAPETTRFCSDGSAKSLGNLTRIHEVLL